MTKYLSFRFVCRDCGPYNVDQKNRAGIAEYLECHLCHVTQARLMGVSKGKTNRQIPAITRHENKWDKYSYNSASVIQYIQP